MQIHPAEEGLAHETSEALVCVEDADPSMLTSVPVKKAVPYRQDYSYRQARQEHLGAKIILRYAPAVFNEVSIPRAPPGISQGGNDDKQKPDHRRGYRSGRDRRLLRVDGIQVVVIAGDFILTEYN